jgi:hypothetical protein
LFSRVRIFALGKEAGALQWTAFPAVEGQSRMNPAKFCNQFRQRQWIARTVKHVFAVINGLFTMKPAGPRASPFTARGKWSDGSTSERPIPHITALP